MKSLLGLLVAILLLVSGFIPSRGYAADMDFPSREQPLRVDREAGMVLIYSEVNANGIKTANPHWGVVSADGSLSEQGILKTYANHLAFHDALVSIGARPGNNLTEETVGVPVEGDPLIVTATWPGLGKELTLEEVFGDETGKGFEIRFGGNRHMSAEAKTGCVMCLESCWVGITSNARYPNISSLRRLISPNSEFTGKADVLPGPGAPVILIYRVADDAIRTGRVVEPALESQGD